MAALGSACSVCRRTLSLASRSYVASDCRTPSFLFYPQCGNLPHIHGTRCSIHVPVNPSSQPSRKAQRRKDGEKSHGGRPSYRFVDRTRVRVVGGSGGKGSLSMHHLGRKHKRRPDGGHGGRGGDVVVVADPNEQTLLSSHPHVAAESGKNGSSQEKHGRKGRTRILRVPCGVVVRRILDHDQVWDPDNCIATKVSGASEEPGYTHFSNDNFAGVGGHTGENDDKDEDFESVSLEGLESSWREPVPVSLSEEEYADSTVGSDELVSSSAELPTYDGREVVVLADLDKPGAYVLAARGGRGGRGNCSFSSRSGPLPPHSMLVNNAKPEDGEVAYLELELKLIADIGLLGFPNAGKSSLLAALSRATPAIAPYPFTTLHPLLGCIEYRDGFRVFAADVPGLVGGASEGRGRGHDFLRHLERTKSLLYIVDAAGVDGRDPVQDLRTLTDELSSYGDGDMMTRKALVVANKFDLLSQTERESLLPKIKDAAEEAGIRFDGQVLGISAGVTGSGLEQLSIAMRNVVLQSDLERDDEKQGVV